MKQLAEATTQSTPGRGLAAGPAHRRGLALPSFRRPGSALSRLISGIMVAALVLLASSCERTTPTDAEREALETVVVAYLNDLARAYSNFDANELSEHATRREMVEVNGLIGKLAASGDRLQATLLQVEITDVEVFRAVNAKVSTMEVWDVARFDAYDGREKNRNPSLIQHGRIQLRLVEGVWRVIGRTVLETQKGGPGDTAQADGQPTSQADG